ncbi:hypothetical protein CcaCcLH18_03456 [Colletotrichum camelliae]|nr:hypothetical protein CcaCcLH18_03456 [Colletotrichum camelliae]
MVAFEFGFKLVTKTIQIKNSTGGLTNENANFLEIANDLKQYADLMSAKWSNYSGKRQLEDHEKFLEEAIKDCQQISNEMQKQIHKCSRKGRHTWGALGQAFEAITKRGSVDSLAKGLEAAKEKITMANLACIIDDGQRSRLSLEQIQNQLEQLTQSVQSGSSRFEKSLGFQDNGNDDPALATEALNGPSRTIQTTWGALNPNSPILKTLFEDLVDKIWNPSWNPNLAKHEDYSPTFLDNFKDHIIRSLRFDQMRKREQEIKDTFEATFEWIWNFDPPSDHGNPAWSSFPNWLECEKDSLYWITGVPGSGKSTLMKYIQHDSKDHLVHHLAKWQPDTPLLLLHYYAWNAGLDELKSCESLLRTILAQGLETEPDVIPHVFKRRLALLWTLSPKALQDFELLPRQPWSLDELQECLQFFLRELDGRRKLVIFVDGLDEFEVPPIEIVAQIRGLCTEPLVKVCVASRPWIEFEETLKPCPHLRVDELTSNDISTYIKGRLEVRQAFLEREFEVSDLTKQIREKAQGVFLWVHLVVEHMLPGFDGGISLAALQQAIDELPDELQELYNVIWRRIPRALKSDASKLFQLFCVPGSSKDMLRMWLAYEGKTPSYDFVPQEDRYTTIRSITIRRLNSHSRGILKLSGQNEVTVAHKTAYEWMLQTDVRNEMARLEPLERTGLSVVYAEKGDSDSVLKAAGFWLDGEMYDRSAFAEDASN